MIATQYQNNRNILKTSVLFSLFFTCNSAPVVFGEIDNLVIYLFIAITVLIIIRNYNKFKDLNNSIIVLSFVIICFCVTFLRSSSNIVSNTLLTFLCFGAPMLMIPYSQVDFNIVIKSIFIQCIILVPFYATYKYGYGAFEGENFEDGTLMTMSYRILPLILSCFCVFVSQPKWNLYKIASSLLAFVYIIILFIIGSRGAQLSTVLFVILLYVLLSKDNNQKIKRSILLIILLMFLIYGFEPLMFYVDNLFKSYNIESLSVTRIVYMLDNGRDLDTGRSALEMLAWRDFIDSPIIGKGIASFNNYRGGYPHNLYIQALGEGGILFGALLLLTFITSLKDIIKYNITNSYVLFVTFIFCAGVIKLFFSSTYWESQFFWTYISLIVNRKYLINKK